MLSAKNRKLVGDANTQVNRAEQLIEQLPLEDEESRAAGLTVDEDRYITAAAVMLSQAAEILELLHAGGGMRKLYEVAPPELIDKFIRGRRPAWRPRKD